MPRGVPRSKDAKHHPVVMTRMIESQEQEIGQGNARLLKSTGNAKDALEPSLIAVQDRPLDDEKMQMLAFMAEPVTIRMATTTDKNAAQVLELCVNGKFELFRRGETKTVPRYYVDLLSRMKETVYSQKEVFNNEGIKDILHVPQTGLKYDFAMVRDDNPLGASWLRAVLAEAG